MLRLSGRGEEGAVLLPGHPGPAYRTAIDSCRRYPYKKAAIKPWILGAKSTIKRRVRFYHILTSLWGHMFFIIPHNLIIAGYFRTYIWRVLSSGIAKRICSQVSFLMALKASSCLFPGYNISCSSYHGATRTGTDMTWPGLFHSYDSRFLSINYLGFHICLAALTLANCSPP